MNERIVVVEDDTIICEELMQFLENNGYSAVTVDFTEEIIEQIFNKKPDLILLDVNLPNQDGFALCRRLRHMSSVPIIFITARDSALDELQGLTIGGDDYITKPYNLFTILARIKNLLRRIDTIEKECIEYKGILVDVISGTLRFKNKSIELSKTELKILYYLFKNSGKIIPRLELIEYLWDNKIHIDDNTLSVYITRIRQKLEEVGIGELIFTKRGMGYKV